MVYFFSLSFFKTKDLTLTREERTGRAECEGSSGRGLEDCLVGGRRWWEAGHGNRDRRGDLQEGTERSRIHNR